MEKMYDVKEAMEALKISKANLYRLMKDGKLFPTKLGKRTLFKESELNRFIESLNGKKN